jgi:hypothetical protein
MMSCPRLTLTNSRARFQLTYRVTNRECGAPQHHAQDVLTLFPHFTSRPTSSAAVCGCISAVASAEEVSDEALAKGVRA